MRILFVAMANSVHSARWIGQLRFKGWDVHLFPVEDFPPHPDLFGITVHSLFKVCFSKIRSTIFFKGIWWPFKRGGLLLGRLLERAMPTFWGRAPRLTRVIRKIQPDIIHSLEMQKAGYLTFEAKRLLKGRFPPWIVTNWGSDIYLFGRLSPHVQKIKAVLSEGNYYSCECLRDVKLAREYGFKGEVLPMVPNSGGYDLKRAKALRQPGPSSVRRVVLLKGYQGWAGRALVGLRAIERCVDVLSGYRIAIYLAGEEVRIAGELLSKKSGLEIQFIPQTSHEEMLRWHGRSRLSIGLSISDAISTSVLEAMVMGSFPIQSYTSCANEWITHKKTGWLVSPEDPEEVAQAIRQIIKEDSLVDQAADLNDRTVKERLEGKMIQKQAVSMYEGIVP